MPPALGDDGPGVAGTARPEVTMPRRTIERTHSPAALATSASGVFIPVRGVADQAYLGRSMGHVADEAHPVRCL